MFYVYILKSLQTDDLYIGYTADLKQRLIEHNSKKSTHTKTKGPYKLIYYEAYMAQKDARHRERSLKLRGQARSALMKRLTFTLASF